MIFLYIAIAWIVLLVVFVIVWARFAGRRRALEERIEQDRLRAHRLHAVDERDGVTSERRDRSTGRGESPDPHDDVA